MARPADVPSDKDRRRHWDFSGFGSHVDSAETKDDDYSLWEAVTAPIEEAERGDDEETEGGDGERGEKKKKGRRRITKKKKKKQEEEEEEEEEEEDWEEEH